MAHTTLELPAITFPVSRVAQTAGVAASAVRFYEKHGVVRAMRDSSNQRRFDESAACRIRVAKLAQRVGLTVREIAALFADLPPDPSPDDWKRIASELIAESERRAADLRACLEEMTSGGRLCEAVDRLPDRPAVFSA